VLAYDTLDLFGQDSQQALPQPDPQWSSEGGLYIIWLSPDKSPEQVRLPRGSFRAYLGALTNAEL